MNRIIIVTIYIVCLFIAMYATSCIKFDKVCDTKEPRKIQILWVLLSCVIAYFVGMYIQLLIRI